MCIYFVSWTSSLLGDPKYAVAVSDSTCGGNCTSYFLPSGIETARRVSGYLNQTLLEGGLFQGGDAIKISNAPGLLDFMALGSTFSFDLENECHVYGTQMNDSLQLCIRQVDSSIAVGKSRSNNHWRGRVGLNRVLSIQQDGKHAQRLSSSIRTARRTQLGSAGLWRRRLCLPHIRKTRQPPTSRPDSPSSTRREFLSRSYPRCEPPTSRRCGITSSNPSQAQTRAA